MNYEKNGWPNESAIQYRIIKTEAEKANKLIEAMYKYAFVDTMKLLELIRERVGIADLFTQRLIRWQLSKNGYSFGLIPSVTFYLSR